MSVKEVTQDEIIALAVAMETRRILEEIKEVFSISNLMHSDAVFKQGFQLACEDIFYRATKREWRMDEDKEKFANLHKKESK